MRNFKMSKEENNHKLNEQFEQILYINTLTLELRSGRFDPYSPFSPLQQRKLSFFS